MATVLWLTLGVLLGLLAWIVPALTVLVPLVVLAFVLVGVLVPREVTSVGAKIGIGFGGLWVAVFSPNVLRDPLGATGETYLLFGGGLVVLLLGVVGLVRNALRRQRVSAQTTEADQT